MWARLADYLETDWQDVEAELFQHMKDGRIRCVTDKTDKESPKFDSEATDLLRRIYNKYDHCCFI